MATVGGNICLSLPAGPMTSLTAALDGVAAIARPDGDVRRLAVADLVTGDGANALAPGELLTRVDLPAAALTGRTAFRQVSLSAVGRSAVLVIARRSPGEHGVTGYGVSVAPMTETHIRQATVITVTASSRARSCSASPPRPTRRTRPPRSTPPSRPTSTTSTAPPAGGRR